MMEFAPSSHLGLVCCFVFLELLVARSSEVGCG